MLLLTLAWVKAKGKKHFLVYFLFSKMRKGKALLTTGNQPALHSAIWLSKGFRIFVAWKCERMRESRVLKAKKG